MKVATPKSEALRFLHDQGLLVPDGVSAEKDAVPVDFTRLNGRQVGAVHSRYAVRHSHAIYVAAQLEGELGALRRDLRIEQARFRALHTDEYKNKYSLDDAMVMDDDVSELMDSVVVVEAKLELVKALGLGYEDLRNAASREMFRRSSEQGVRD